MRMSRLRCALDVADSVWRDMETLHFVALSDIIDTLVFADDGCGFITVLHFLWLRS